MKGLPVTIRLLDPPLHEFVPQSRDNQVELAKALKISIEDGRPAAIGVDMLAKAVDEEFMETQDAVLDADPEQWSRINGLDAGHVTSIRQVA